MLETDQLIQLSVGGVAAFAFLVTAVLSVRFWSEHREMKTLLRAIGFSVLTAWAFLYALAVFFPLFNTFSIIALAIGALSIAASYIMGRTRFHPVDDKTVSKIVAGPEEDDVNEDYEFAPGTAAETATDVTETAEEPAPRAEINQNEILPPLAKPKRRGLTWMLGGLVLLAAAALVGVFFFGDSVSTKVFNLNEETAPPVLSEEELTPIADPPVEEEPIEELVVEEEVVEEVTIQFSSEVGFVNVRTAASTNGELVQKISEGEDAYSVEYTVLAVETDELKKKWVQFELADGKTAWLRTDLLKVVSGDLDKVGKDNEEDSNSETTEETTSEPEASGPEAVAVPTADDAPSGLSSEDETTTEE